MSEVSTPQEPDPTFCADWNPDFTFNGHKCCARYLISHRRKANLCSPARYKTSYCGEMTEEQRLYTDLATNGKLGDMLTLIATDLGKRGEQAYCSVNNGF